MLNALTDPDLALHWVTRLAGLAVFLSSLELLSLRREFFTGGFYCWDPESPTATAPWFIPAAVWRRICRSPMFLGLVSIRMALAGLLMFDVPTGPARAATLLLTLAISLVMGIRLEYGMSGADPMMGVVLGGLGITALVPDTALVRHTGLWFVALQTTFAYAAAGVTKIYIPAWRKGTYLTTALESGIYGHPLAARALSAGRISLLMSWTVIVWECTFPLAFLLGGPGAMIYCAIGLAFHLGIALFMGLKMFVFIFAATYPAVIACAVQAHRILISGGSQ